MTIMALLNSQQKALWQRERELLQRAVDILEGWDVAGEDRARLQGALDQLDELFLLVVVGEFNSGKSALINALLGHSYLQEGVTPTTDRIHILSYGEEAPPQIVTENIRALTFPAEMLREIHIVDTPGTNAVMRQHEVIAREFVPRSDLVLFVTSADRPFTESERAFLESIRQWGKKVIIVINKVDILKSSDAAEEIRTFVRDQVKRLLDFEPAMFMVSARDHMEGIADPRNAFPAFIEHMESALSGENMIRLKLLNPLGVSQKVARQYEAIANERLSILHADLESLKKVEANLAQFRDDTQEEFGRQLDRIDKALLQMQLRGEEFIDDRMRLIKLRGMMRSGEMRSAFEHEVVGTTPASVETDIQEIIDWLVERELRQWRMMADELGRRKDTSTLQNAAREAAGGFNYNRRQLLDRVGKQTEAVIRGFDRSFEAERLVSSVQESIALVGLVEVSAVGLGVILQAILTTAAADATGILAAGILSVLGFAIIPLRRGRAKADLRKKMTDLQHSLREVLSENFHREFDTALAKLHEAITPYQRFVREEEDHLSAVAKKLRELSVHLQSLGLEIDPHHED